MNMIKKFPSVLILLSFACAPAPVRRDEIKTDQAVIQSLREGNIRFTSHQRVYPRQDHGRLMELAKGQAPGVVLVSCSDSRIPPEAVFDQGLGDVFSVRTAGHVLETASIASIEYAVEVLGASVVMVMGHSSCGAVKAAAASKKGVSSGSKNLDQLIQRIQPNLKKRSQSDPDYTLAAEDQVDGTISYLKANSPLIRERVLQGKVKMVSALYDVATGEVELWQ